MELKSGDKIGIIFPSSAPKDWAEVDKSVTFLKEQGFEVKLFGSPDKKAQSEEQKIHDLLSAFEDKKIKAIICGRGGHGAIKILDNIDYSIVKRNPKIFAGSSDITTLLIAFYKLSALKTFHSPMLLGQGKFNKKSFEDFLKTINGKKTDIKPKKDFTVLNQGRGTGVLWGGNLATIVSLFGTYSGFYTPNDNIILFLEDLNEEVYKIDRMLTQIYRNKTLARKIKGVIFGDFLGADEKELTDVLCTFAKKLGVPATFGYNITHLKTNTTVPVGQFVKFDTKNSVLKFIG